VRRCYSAKVPPSYKVSDSASPRPKRLLVVALHSARLIKPRAPVGGHMTHIGACRIRLCKRYQVKEKIVYGMGCANNLDKSHFLEVHAASWHGSDKPASDHPLPMISGAVRDLSGCKRLCARVKPSYVPLTFSEAEHGKHLVKRCNTRYSRSLQWGELGRKLVPNIWRPKVCFWPDREKPSSLGDFRC
jgi:hypothetical protein